MPKPVQLHSVLALESIYLYTKLCSNALPLTQKCFFCLDNRIFPQLIPESPCYLVFHGKEEKAKKVLALIAKVNRKAVPTGRLMIAEKKEQLLKGRNLPLNDVAESTKISGRESEAKEAINGTLTNMDNNGTLPNNDDSIVISSDSVLSLDTNPVQEWMVEDYSTTVVFMVSDC